MNIICKPVFLFLLSSMLLFTMSSDGTASYQLLPAQCRLTITSNPLQYSGYYYDLETGLCYLKARYYSPIYGNFTSKDTYDLNNRYSYCGGDPVNATDPEGHVWESLFPQKQLYTFEQLLEKGVFPKETKSLEEIMAKISGASGRTSSETKASEILSFRVTTPAAGRERPGYTVDPIVISFIQPTVFKPGCMRILRPLLGSSPVLQNESNLRGFVLNRLFKIYNNMKGSFNTLRNEELLELSVYLAITPKAGRCGLLDWFIDFRKARILKLKRLEQNALRSISDNPGAPDNVQLVSNLRAYRAELSAYDIPGIDE